MNEFVFSFNPTLVRLRPGGRGITRLRVYLFQSHAGSIEARIRTLVRISRSFVSIPRWFD